VRTLLLQLQVLLRLHLQGKQAKLKKQNHKGFIEHCGVEIFRGLVIMTGPFLFYIKVIDGSIQ